MALCPVIDVNLTQKTALRASQQAWIVGYGFTAIKMSRVNMNCGAYCKEAIKSYRNLIPIQE